MSKLHAIDFFSDLRVTKAKNDVLLALKDHQSKITQIRPPISDLKLTYQNVIESFSKMRGGNLLVPYLSSGLGRGALVELSDGSVKYDFISGIGVHILGHSHPELIAAAFDAALSDTIMQGNLQQDIRSVGFTKTLLDMANAKGACFDHCFLTATGVMGGENALKIAFQKKHPADRILAFEHCFMGRTLAMSQATDKPAYRVGLPKTLAVDYVPFFDPDKPKESTDAAVTALKKHLTDYPGKYAAMCFELVLGEGGFYPGDRDFFMALIRVLKENDILILVDEVQTFCRLTEPFAFQYFGLGDFVDVVWVGKASQVCATLFRADLKPKPGLLSQTYTGSSAAIAAGQKVIAHMMDGGYYGPDGKIAKMHAYFKARLQAISQRHPELISGPYGMGGMIGFQPLDGTPDKVKKFTMDLFEAGVMGLSTGENPTRFRFLPPVGVVTNEDIDVVMEVVEKTLMALT